MKSSPELHQLIKSMSKSEKRFFKLSASIHTGDKNYLILFDAIEKQNNYDEEKLKADLKAHRFVDNLAYEKNYLFKQILKTLRNYHSAKTIDFQLTEMLEEIFILQSRGLHKASNKLVEKAKKIAEQHERHSYLIELLKWEWELMHFRFAIDEVEKNVPDIIAQYDAIAKKITNLNQYKIIASKVFVNTYRGTHIRGEEQQRVYRDIAALPYLVDETKALSYDARSYFYLLKSNLFFVQRDWKNALISTEKLLKLLESNPTKIEEEPRKYLVVLNNLMSTCVALYKKEELFFYIEKMETFSKQIDTGRGTAVKNEAFLCANYARLEYYIRMGLFKEGLTEMDKVRNEVLRVIENPLFTNHAVLFKNTFAELYFGIKNYNKAIYWINQIINSGVHSFREDILSGAILLNIIIHYEKGNDDILDYLVRSAYRHFYKKNRLYKFENIILAFIRKKLAKADTKEKLFAAFKSLRKELSELANDPYESKAFEQFDFIAWLDSKIYAKPYDEMVRKAAKQLV